MLQAHVDSVRESRGGLMRRIRVLYDAGGFQEPFGGVSYSLCETIRHLPNDIEPIFAVAQTCNVTLQSPPFNIPGYCDKYHGFILRSEFRGKWRLWKTAQRLLPWLYPDHEARNRLCLEEHLRDEDFDVLHVTAPHAYGDVWRKIVGKKPIVVTVHDLIPEIIQHSECVSVGRREMLSEASHVIAVSENTKRDIIRLYGINEKKVSVVHHGAPQIKVSKTIASSGQPSTSDYFLFVGGRGGYKNWAWTVAALAPILKNGLRLVCTGHPFSATERMLLRRLGVAGRVEHRYVCADQFPALYSRALAFVYPSIYEGFGLPILDAFASHCPVVLSRCPCFAEVAGDAADYFNASDPVGLRALVDRLRNDGQHREELVERGIERLGKFSWLQSAERVANVYRQVLG